MAFRRLSHDFTVRCNDGVIGAYVSRVLARCAVAEPVEGAASYDVLDLGPSGGPSRFRLHVGGRWVLGSEDPAHVLNDLFSHVNLDTVRTTRDLVLVHAGAVVTPQGSGVVLPAPSGSGKSTLVAGLVRAGFGYLSDEAAVIDPTTGMLHPYPVHLSLKAASRDHFLDARPQPADLAYSKDTWHVDPEAIRPGSVAVACEVGFVIPHRFTPGDATVVDPLSPAEACMDLMRNLMLARDTPRSLELMARICRVSRSFRLTHGDLDEAVQAIVELTGA